MRQDIEEIQENIIALKIDLISVDIKKKDGGPKQDTDSASCLDLAGLSGCYAQSSSSSNFDTNSICHSASTQKEGDLEEESKKAVFYFDKFDSESAISLGSVNLLPIEK